MILQVGRGVSGSHPGPIHFTWSDAGAREGPGCRCKVFSGSVSFEGGKSCQPRVGLEKRTNWNYEERKLRCTDPQERRGADRVLGGVNATPPRKWCGREGRWGGGGGSAKCWEQGSERPQAPGPPELGLMGEGGQGRPSLCSRGRYLT